MYKTLPSISHVLQKYNLAKQKHFAKEQIQNLALCDHRKRWSQIEQATPYISLAGQKSSGIHLKVLSLIKAFYIGLHWRRIYKLKSK